MAGRLCLSAHPWEVLQHRYPLSLLRTASIFYGRPEGASNHLGKKSSTRPADEGPGRQRLTTALPPPAFPEGPIFLLGLRLQRLGTGGEAEGRTTARDHQRTANEVEGDEVRS